MLYIPLSFCFTKDYKYPLDISLSIPCQMFLSHDQATLFVEHSTNTNNNLFVDPQKNLFVAICGLLYQTLIKAYNNFSRL